MIYTVRTVGPLADTAGAPGGRVQYWEVAEAVLAGDGFTLTLAKPGSDWMMVGEDGFWRPDVRMALSSPEGDTILLHYTGLVEQTEAFKAAAEADRETGFGDNYIRMILHFSTGAAKWRWLTQSLFIADGRLLGTGRLEYRIYRVS